MDSSVDVTGEEPTSTSQPLAGHQSCSDAERNSADHPAPDLQNLFVMRHGERMDDADELWVKTAARPWDPPLTEKGQRQAWTAGKRLRNEGWDITRVLVSPFLRCVQTAAEVVTALCLVDASSDARSSREAVIDPSRVRVSFEFGLCELMNGRAIRNPPQQVTELGAPIPWHLELSELQSMLPQGTFDSLVKSIWPQIPAWRESMQDAHQRYASTLSALTARHVSENVLCITHGQAVGVSIAEFQFLVYAVDYCAHAHMQRPIYNRSADGSFTSGNWELLTESGPSGVLYGNFHEKDTF